MTLNNHIIDAVKAAKSVDATTGKVWAGVVSFIYAEGVTKENFKEAFKEQERAYEEQYKVQPSSFSAYRSAKSVANNALKNGIELMVDGVIRGKTEIEKANKDAKADKKSSYDKWVSMYDKLNEQTNALMTEYEIVQAYGAVDKLRSKLSEMLEAESKQAA